MLPSFLLMAVVLFAFIGDFAFRREM